MVLPSFIKSVFQKGFSHLTVHHSVLAKQRFSAPYLLTVSQEDMIHGLVLDMVILENFRLQVGAARQRSLSQSQRGEIIPLSQVKWEQ